jgi:hypothetical protein
MAMNSVELQVIDEPLERFRYHIENDTFTQLFNQTDPLIFERISNQVIHDAWLKTDIQVRRLIRDHCKESYEQ